MESEGLRSEMEGEGLRVTDGGEGLRSERRRVRVEIRD